jgi:serine/threonine protein kinase
MVKLIGIGVTQDSQNVFSAVAFMAPEVIKGEECDEKCDIWSLGCILFLILTGELPFGNHVAKTIK